MLALSPHLYRGGDRANIFNTSNNYKQFKTINIMCKDYCLVNSTENNKISTFTIVAYQLNEIDDDSKIEKLINTWLNTVTDCCKVKIINGDIKFYTKNKNYNFITECNRNKIVFNLFCIEPTFKIVDCNSIINEN